MSHFVQFTVSRLQGMVFTPPSNVAIQNRYENIFNGTSWYLAHLKTKAFTDKIILLPSYQTRFGSFFHQESVELQILVKFSIISIF